MKKFFMISGCALAAALFVMGFMPNAPGFPEDNSADRALMMAEDAQVLTSVAPNVDPLSDRVRRKINEDIVARGK